MLGKLYPENMHDIELKIPRHLVPVSSKSYPFTQKHSSSSPFTVHPSADMQSFCFVTLQIPSWEKEEIT
jgi:hypothetical protein